MKLFKQLVANWTIKKSFVSILVLYVLLALGASIQSYLLESNAFGGYTEYNNYVIFKQSHFHLLNNTNLYKHYNEEQWDLFKYSPTFAVVFGAFSYLPDLLGLSLWNILNCLVFFLAIYKLPAFDQRKKIFVLFFCVIELMTSMQNEQCNGLIAGMIVLSFGLLEKRNYLVATLLLVSTFYIKIFGIVAFSLFLLYPQKWKLAAYTLLWTVVLFVLPLLVVDFGVLTTQYQNWLEMLQMDHGASYGLSVMGFLKSWFNVGVDKMLIVALGAFMFCLPLVFYKKYKNSYYRLLILSSALIWVIIFNHKAESSTFIIAITGIALWFYSSDRNVVNLILVLLAFVFISLSPTDIFPRSIRVNYVNPYTLKAVPAILIWIKILYDSMFSKQIEMVNNTQL